MRETVRKMTAYKPPLEGRSSDPSRLLLDFNERTQPVAPEVIDAVIAYLKQGRIHVYPEYGDLTQKLAAYASVSPDQVMLTNGSDHGIELIYRATTEPGDEVIVPVPTFAMLTHCAEVQGASIRAPLITKERGYPLDEVLGLLTEQTRLVVLCNPNAPTGGITPLPVVERLLRATEHTTVLVDECYFEYASATVQPFLEKYPHLLITRTFSKTWGLAGLRLGYILGSVRNINHLMAIRGPYDMNMAAVVAAGAALDNPSYMYNYTNEVKNVSRPRFLAYLAKRGIPFWPSDANFVLIEPYDSVKLEQELRLRGIFVRPRGGPGIDGTLRITLGTASDIDRVIRAMDELEC
jgi:histidinol-phosphate aminotransferase